MNLFDITGKKAIVTGGTRGLGYGMAEGFLEAGCEVAIVGTSDKVYEVAEDFQKRFKVSLLPLKLVRFSLFLLRRKRKPGRAGRCLSGIPGMCRKAGR